MSDVQAARILDRELCNRCRGRVNEIADHMLAAIEPNIRADERAKVLAQINALIDLGMEEEEQVTPPIVYGYAPNGEMLVHIDRVREILEGQP